MRRSRGARPCKVQAQRPLSTVQSFDRHSCEQSDTWVQCNLHVNLFWLRNLGSENDLDAKAKILNQIEDKAVTFVNRIVE